MDLSSGAFNFPVFLDKYDIEGLSNIQKVELAEFIIFEHSENAESYAKELPLKHHITPFNEELNLYGREIFLPKNTLLTGKVHNFNHISTLSCGDVSVMTSEGVERIKAPSTWASKAGTKRLIFVHEDTIWTTYHITRFNDIEQIEGELVFNSNLSWLKEIKKRALL